MVRPSSYCGTAEQHLLFFYPPVDGKVQLKLTALPRIFIHVVCRFNQTAFAIQLVFWRVLRFLPPR